MSRIVEFVVILDDGVRKLIAMKQREAMFSILLYSWKSKSEMNGRWPYATIVHMGIHMSISTIGRGNKQKGH